MTEDLDRRLAALFAGPDPVPDAAFADRIIALAAHDQAVRVARRRALARVAKEAIALTAIFASFAFLARHAPDAASAGFGDSIALGSQAMMGLVALVFGSLAAARPGALSR